MGLRYWALPLVLLAGALQQTTLRHKLKIDSVGADALVVSGGLTLGIDLQPQYGGVAERTVVFFNATACPPPLVLFPNTIPGVGTLIACLYAPIGSSQLGSALLGSARLQ